MLIDDRSDPWAVRQIVSDPEGHDEWRLVGSVDLAASRQAGSAVVVLVGLERL